MDRPPLREQFRATTRRLIADAAVDLAQDVGVANLRAEDIAARVGVSRRTFFNYATTTDGALSIPIDDYLEAANEYFVARPAGEGIVAAMVASVGQVDPDIVDRFERVLLVLATAQSPHPSSLETWNRHESAVREIIATRLPERADPLFVATTAAAVMGAGRAAAAAWAAEVGSAGAGSGRRRRPELTDYIARALSYLAALDEPTRPIRRRRREDP